VGRGRSGGRVRGGGGGLMIVRLIAYERSSYFDSFGIFGA
jgi:hypothetical protein